MPILTPENTYEVLVSVEGYETQDITSYNVFRFPFQGVSSFAILTFPITLEIYIILDDKVRNNELVELTIRIDKADPSKDDPSNKLRTAKKNDYLITKKYKIMYVHSQETQNFTADHSKVLPKVTFYLMNPVLLYMMSETHNSFNSIETDTNAFDVLETYEGHLSYIYGDKTFSFVKIGDSEEKNEHIYEQLLIKLKNDLFVPNYILRNYRAFNAIVYYFFDDFRTTQDEGDITGLMINIHNKEVFNKTDINDEGHEDLKMGTKLTNITPLIDITSKFKKDNAFITVKGPDAHCKYFIPGGPVQVPQIDVVAEDSKIHEERKFKATTPTTLEKEKDPTQFLTMYAPDDVDVAQARYKLIGTFLRETLHAVYSFKNESIHPDMIQFDRIYNFEVGEETNFSFVPIAIVNTFKKSSTSPKMTTVKHHCRFQCIKYKSDG